VQGQQQNGDRLDQIASHQATEPGQRSPQFSVFIILFRSTCRKLIATYPAIRNGLEGTDFFISLLPALIC
jgi:hypothetical protein